MRRPAFAALAALVLGGCAASSEQGPGPAAPYPYQPPAGAWAPAPWAPPPGAAPLYQWGRASFYSDRLAGRRTATGEPYDPSALTAAHPSLPFGTLVDVARGDGRHVTVRINDRGPHARGRIIDLSRRAAAELGMIREGVCEVALRVVSAPPTR